jgi:leader peptidase (prepilin peptidase)/N-methyltransferase
MGLGDADLLMMAGAFLGWQIAVLSLFVGAMTALVMKLAALALGGSGESAPAPGEAGTPAPVPVGGLPPEDARELPFGPGLAAGVVVTWFAWPWLGPRVQYVFFDLVTLGLSVFILCVGVLAAGLLLRRPEEVEEPQAKV